jgi:hypothetical protein
VFKIVAYQTADGKQLIEEYLAELGGKTDKNNRVRHDKIAFYLRVLREYGTRAGGAICEAYRRRNMGA